MYSTFKWKLLWQHTWGILLTDLFVYSGRWFFFFEQCPIAWVVEKWFWGQHENSQKYKPVSSEILTSFIPLHVPHFSCSFKTVQQHGSLMFSQSSLHRDSHHFQFPALYSFQSAPELSVRWLKWMSLPNNLNCSHTVTTPRGWTDFAWTTTLCTIHVGLSDWSEKRRRDTLLILRLSCFTHPWHSKYDFFCLFLFFLLKICSKRTVTMFSGRLDASFVLVGAALTFLPIERQNCSEVDACS